MEADKLQLKADREALDVQKKAFIEEKEGLKASMVQATGDNQWLIEHGFQQGLKPAVLNEKVCFEVLESLSKKRFRSGDSEETFSDDADGSKEASLEGSAVASDGGQKAKKAKKAKKGKGDGTGASKPSYDV
ncbi:hypothetical protein HanIR_Chr02g0086431 [Helianthus annuus]|nr:hypothetical protein HanIR_Chr02g0086431 [Helianthus annuus]KAJ0777776.1 hypothetical protein HanLR1_Chr02g0064361 [Helianthus annuus]